MDAIIIFRFSSNMPSVAILAFDKIYICNDIGIQIVSGCIQNFLAFYLVKGKNTTRSLSSPAKTWLPVNSTRIKRNSICFIFTPPMDTDVERFQQFHFDNVSLKIKIEASRRESTLNARVAFNGVERRPTNSRTHHRVFMGTEKPEIRKN